jgi:predicted PurR-regulated permease PerM
MKFSSRTIAIAITLILIALLVYFFSDIVAYVVISWVLSMLGQPLMDFFMRIRIRKFKLGRNISAVLVLLVYTLVVALLLWLFVPLIVEQANNLADVDYNSIAIALEDPINQINAWMEDKGLVQNARPPEEQLKDALKLEEWFRIGQLSDVFGYLLSAAGNIFISLFSIIFVTFFFLREQRLFGDFMVAVVPVKYEKQVQNAIQTVSRLLTRYFGGILLQVTIITLFISIGLSILGVKNALLIGFFAGLINVIPYLGPIIGAAFGVFITISSNLDLTFYTEMLPLLLKVVAVFAAMQLTDNFLLQPWIFSKSVLAHPLEIFIIILMGAQLGGITGMVLAIPTYTVLRVIARGFLSEFRIVQKLTERMGQESPPPPGPNV